MQQGGPEAKLCVAPRPETCQVPLTAGEAFWGGSSSDTLGIKGGLQSPGCLSPERRVPPLFFREKEHLAPKWVSFLSQLVSTQESGVSPDAHGARGRAGGSTQVPKA